MMEQIWPDFCCEGFNFVVFDVDSSGYGYGICMNPDCPYGDDVQGFQLEGYGEEEVEEYYEYA